MSPATRQPSNAPSWVGAAEAARLLGVRRATLYAYVSRNLVRSQALPGSMRERGYAREDLERLRRRAEERDAPDKAAARALQWGLPVLESSLSLIDGRHLYYRGHDAIELARARAVQSVASLLWTGNFDATFAALPARRPAVAPPSLPFLARAQATLAQAAVLDPSAYDNRAERVAQCGWRILHLLTRAATGTSRIEPTIEQTLAGAWRASARGADLLRAALVLCADHELNVSSFTARCVASAGATPYAVVLAGLAALSGSRHGGASARAEAMLAAWGRERDLGRAIAERVQRGERIEGFGHPLYSRGDPRAAALLRWLREAFERSAELSFVERAAARAEAAVGERPNIDFALAAMVRVLRLPAGAPFVIFAIGRTIGWIGHAIEQYATGQLIRPRAKYVGVVPVES
ncbi:MAG TPA: citrate synthase [Burkholderiaceae bacterium]|nr:citrate synthase [Burkholderiaceae bacterium]